MLSRSNVKSEVFVKTALFSLAKPDFFNKTQVDPNVMHVQVAVTVQKLE